MSADRAIFRYTPGYAGGGMSYDDRPGGPRPGRREIICRRRAEEDEITRTVGRQQKLPAHCLNGMK